MPHSVIGKIVATPPAKITFLNNHELAGLKVRRSNPFRNQSAVQVAQGATAACNPPANVVTEVLAAGPQSCATSAEYRLGNREVLERAQNFRSDRTSD